MSISGANINPTDHDATNKFFDQILLVALLYLLVHYIHVFDVIFDKPSIIVGNDPFHNSCLDNTQHLAKYSAFSGTFLEP